MYRHVYAWRNRAKFDYLFFFSFVKLFENLPNFGNKILTNPLDTLKICDDGIKQVQNKIISENLENNSQLTIKNNVHTRIFGLPACPELHRTIFPKNCDLGKFLKICGKDSYLRFTYIYILCWCGNLQGTPYTFSYIFDRILVLTIKLNDIQSKPTKFWCFSRKMLITSKIRISELSSFIVNLKISFVCVFGDFYFISLD